MPVFTLPELFQRAVHEHGPRTAMRYRGEDGWHPITYAQFGRLVEEACVGLTELDVQAGNRVGILAENGPLWAVADFATLHAGAVTTPVYPTLKSSGIAEILDDAGCELVFVQDGELVDRLASVAGELDELSTIVVMGGSPRGREDPESLDPPTELGEAITMGELYALGQTVLGSEGAPAFEERWRGVDPEDLATLIYTSGTTGRPKGVRLTHRNIVSNVEVVSSIVDVDPGDRYLSFLPLSHSFERVPGHFGLYHNGVEVWFARSIDTVAEDLADCRPHLMLAVPRLYEKMKQRVDERLRASEDTQQRLFSWAYSVGERVLEAREQGRSPPWTLKAKQWVADRLVLSKVRGAMGLDALDLAASGGAALDPDVARWFFSIGIPVLEGYGQTEASPVISVNRPDDFKIGSVGKPVPSVDVRIDEEAWEGEDREGEILARGPSIMAGYWNDPDATGSTLTEDGWLRTGDVGYLDEEGYLYVTDRKKELFKTAYGKYVAPEHVSRQLKRSPLVEQVLVLGEERKYVAVLLQPNFEALEAWADEEGIEAGGRQALVEHPRVVDRFEEIVEEANEGLDRHEQVKRFLLVAEPWDVGEELTPTLKPKRRVLEERYADEIESLFDGS